VEALERVVHCLDRSFENGFKTKAFVRALDVVRSLPAEEIEERARLGTLSKLDGIGQTTARLIREVLETGTSPYLDKIDQETKLPISPAAAEYRAALKGDCHLHSRWSDGGATIEKMARAAAGIGHEYMVLTDHSARLTIAHGLDRDRLLAQFDEIDEVRERVAPFRLLRGMEVDIFEDGSLDLDDDLLERLDVVVASVHSKLRQERTFMTQRMVRAVASPHVDILGHCTGRMVTGSRGRPGSDFDADYVFAACAQFNTAVEINCRPERLDPPPPLLSLAIDHGCSFSIDSDAHSTGQLEWQPHGCEMAANAGVPINRIINTRGADDLLEWTRAAAA
jgi:putative hydrolase